MRFPIPLARMLGNITATYRWFSIFYLLSMFFLLPLIVFSLSTLGTTAMIMIGGPIMLLLALVVIFNLLQTYYSAWLPIWLQNWDFLPLWMHSLDPIDRVITKMSEKFGCMNCCATNSAMQHVHVSRGRDSLKLGHHNNTHHSQLHILDSMYKSTSENHFPNLFTRSNSVSGCVNEKIKKVMFKLAKASHNNLDENNITNDKEPYGAEYRWPQFNSHTVHNCYEVHRYYLASPFMADGNGTASPPEIPTDNKDLLETENTNV